MNETMSKDDVWQVVAKRRSEIVGKLRSFEANGVDVDGLYTDAAIKLVEGDTSTLIEEKLPGLLYNETREACSKYLTRHGNDPKRQELYETEWFEEGSSCDRVNGPSAAQLKAELEIGWRDWKARERHLDAALRLHRIPRDIALTYALYHYAGYTLKETASTRDISEWTIRRHLLEASAALKQIDIDEANGTLKPRAPYETLQHRAAREAIEGKCAAYRPKATKPTLAGAGKPDPRTFWFSTETIRFHQWLAEVERRIARGERHPHMPRRPLRSLDHKMYDLWLMVQRARDQAKERQRALPMAA